MPALPNSALFLNLIIDFPVVFEWSGFQQLTGLTVVPFSDACTAEDIDFPPDQYEAALAFFREYKTHETTEARSSFLKGRGDAQNDGRKAVKAWITAKWKEWDVSETIAKGLREGGFDGFEYHRDSEDSQWQDSKAAQISLANVHIAHALFGTDSIDKGRKRVKPAILSLVQTLGAASWKAQGRAWVRARNRLGNLHRTLDTDYEALNNAENMTANEISRIIKRIKTVTEKVDKFSDEEMTQVVKLWEERLNVMRDAAVKDKAANAKLPAALRNALTALADSPTIRFIVEEVSHALIDMQAQPPQDPLPEVVISYDDWASSVEEFQNKTPMELWDMLGLPNQALPGFNPVEDPDGVVDPWTSTDE